jgi:hypothetical protein
MPKGIYKRKPPGQRFWENVTRTNYGCLLWAGAKDKNGYGLIKVDGVMMRAHRFSWFLHTGKNPEQFILHKCDNPPCVSPDHLFEGTPKDNTHDCMKKGRFLMPKGSKHGHSKLTEKQVLMIRKDKRSNRELANEYKVHITTIRYIKSRHTWRHI